MRASHSLDRLDAAFDDEHLVADGGLLLPATLAHHLGLKDLVEAHLDLGRAHVGDKLLTLVLSALAGGHAHAAARDLRGAVAYAIRAARAAAPESEREAAGRVECQWQRAEGLWPKDPSASAEGRSLWPLSAR